MRRCFAILPPEGFKILSIFFVGGVKLCSSHSNYIYSPPFKYCLYFLAIHPLEDPPGNSQSTWMSMVPQYPTVARTHNTRKSCLQLGAWPALAYAPSSGAYWWIFTCMCLQAAAFGSMLGVVDPLSATAW